MMNRKTVLRRQLQKLQEAAPRVSTYFQYELQGLAEGCPDQQVPATLRMLTAPLVACDMTITLKEGAAFTTSWQQSTGALQEKGDDVAQHAIRSTFLLLAKHGRLPEVSQSFRIAKQIYF